MFTGSWVLTTPVASVPSDKFLTFRNAGAKLQSGAVLGGPMLGKAVGSFWVKSESSCCSGSGYSTKVAAGSPWVASLDARREGLGLVVIGPR